jgi:hypothetical protein
MELSGPIVIQDLFEYNSSVPIKKVFILKNNCLPAQTKNSPIKDQSWTDLALILTAAWQESFLV